MLQEPMKKIEGETMSFAVDINNIKNMAAQDGILSESSNPNTEDENIDERLKKAAQDGDIERLYMLIAENPHILGKFDKLPFCETPLHIAAEKGHTHFAMELMTLQPSLALKLNPSGFSAIHLALQNNHTRLVRGFIAIDSSLVSIKGKGRFTPLHHAAKLGDAQLLSEFLFACPSSIEDLTVKCETVLHVAMKSCQIEAFKVLFGWVERANREEILNWKDEDGNTVFHIAALINQTEVMMLLRKTVKIRAKNLDGKTAMEMHQSPISPTARSQFNIAKERLFGPITVTLVTYLTTKPSWIERWHNLLGLSNLNKTGHKSNNGSDTRSVILVVAILIATTTYQANLSPPGGYWQEDSKDDAEHLAGQMTMKKAKPEHLAGEMTMSYVNAIVFHIFNGYAFFSSVYVITILIVGLPMWKVLFGSIVAIGVANCASFAATLPNPGYSIARGLTELIFVLVYPVIIGVIVFARFVVFALNKHRRFHVDFPARYFTSPHELS